MYKQAGGRRLGWVLAATAALIAGSLVSHGVHAASVADDAAAERVLVAVDQVHNPRASFVSTSTLVEYRHGVAQSTVALRVYAKIDPASGQYRNLARYVAPAQDSGKMFLMSGQDMWFYDPAASASIRISPQQRLLGEASVGDVLSLNLSKEFEAHLVGEETIDDASRKPVDTWHLNLLAKNASVIYARVEYWVQKKTYFPIKAYFYSDSGRILKIAYYLAVQQELGGERPTKVIILDDVDTSLATEITFSGYKTVDIPDDWFQHEYLPRLH